MNWKTSITAFFVAIGAACVIPFVAVDETEFKKDPQPTTQAVKEEQKPVILQDGTNITNIVERALNPNTGWFSDSSKYIWDDWKIK